jgi:hypothetical protein
MSASEFHGKMGPKYRAKHLRLLAHFMRSSKLPRETVPSVSKSLHFETKKIAMTNCPMLRPVLFGYGLWKRGFQNGFAAPFCRWREEHVSSFLLWASRMPFWVAPFMRHYLSTLSVEKTSAFQSTPLCDVKHGAMPHVSSLLTFPTFKQTMRIQIATIRNYQALDASAARGSVNHPRHHCLVKNR